jgi:glycosyltransferase involved in cell wall biosynthesis
VFVFGGKIDERKNVSQLLKAFSMLPGEDPSKKAWLIIFGRPVAAIEPEFTRLVAQDRVVNLQWVPAYRTHEVFWASDFAVFPGTHSVLWEEAAGFGLPIAVKRWKGIEHVDVGGNCIFLETADVSEIYELLRRVVDDRSFFESMRRVSSTVAVEKFSYTKIAARALHG